MIYSLSYAKSIKDKVEILSKMQSQIDQIGALYSSLILDPYTKNGKSKSDLTDFSALYGDLFPTTFDQNLNYIVNYDSIVTDYITKAWTYKQDFLKNIYSFTNYFNTPYLTAIDGSKNLFKDTISLDGSADVTENDSNIIERTISFQDLYFNSVDKDFDFWVQDPQASNYGKALLPIYIQDNNNYVETDVVDAAKIANGEYYSPLNSAGKYFSYHTISGSTSNTLYNPNQTYYAPVVKIDLEKGATPDEKIFEQRDGELLE